MISQERGVALVTGASRGIGKAVAVALAAEGLRVAVHFGKSAEEAAVVAKSLDGEGHQAFGANLLQASAPEDLMSMVCGEMGRIDVLVNNAGIYEKLTPAEAAFAVWRENWERTIAVNLTAPAHLAFLAASRMKAQGRGRIINISSRGAFRGEATAPPYGAAKAGLNALGQSLAKAYARHGVCVFSIAPGWVETEMAAPHIRGARAAEIVNEIPLGRVAQPEEIARIVAWLATSAPASMTGGIIDANGASYLRT